MQPSPHNFADTLAITCPSGLAGVIRNMTVGESRVLTGKRRDTARQLDALVTACWQETTEPGPYDFEDGKIRWGSVLQGDRFYTLMQIRILTFGDEYAFAVPCQSRLCGRRVDWSLNLSELPVRSLSPNSHETFKAGNKFEVALPGGHRGIFGLPIGNDEARLSNTQAGDENILPNVLNVRLREIDGVPPLQRKGYLNQLSLRQARDLLAEFDKFDCGVETNIDIECPHCGYAQEVGLPLDQGFLWPQTSAGYSPSAA